MWLPGCIDMKPASWRKPGYTCRPPPAYLIGTVAITFCSNRACGRCVASVLTAVGALRVSIGPPIIVSVFGRQGLRSALISAVAARHGTEGWQTASKIGRAAVRERVCQYV